MTSYKWTGLINLVSAGLKINGLEFKFVITLRMALTNLWPLPVLAPAHVQFGTFPCQEIKIFN